MSDAKAVEVSVAVDIDVPVGRVWRALCEPEQVCEWDGARVVTVSDDYPAVGEHARWRIPVGSWWVMLHDRPYAVEAHERLASRLSWLWVVIDEEYTLAPGPEGHGTHLVSTNRVGTRLPFGLLRALSARIVRDAVTASMQQLKAHCEAQ
ncbi:MAG: SRPBCC family protein [Acidimicrobiia bacterium]|nr:SRPBCC family protein [Acidimicrobiia bacterium]